MGVKPMQLTLLKLLMQLDNTYNSLIQNTFGNFNISTILIKTAFSQSDENKSVPFEEFKSNRLVIANRLGSKLLRCQWI